MSQLLDSDLTIVPLDKVDRDQAAHLYATLQEGNALFASLNADFDDVALYGGFLYDMCVPYNLSIGAVAQDGTLAAIHLQVPSQGLTDAVTRGVTLGGAPFKCAPHVLLCHFLQKRLIARWGGDVSRLLYGIFSGLGSCCRGSGLFPKMMGKGRRMAAEQGLEHAWGFYKDVDMIKKGIQAMASDGYVAQTVAGGIADTLWSTPAGMLEFLNGTFSRNFLEGASCTFADASHLRVNGRYPFKSRQLVLGGLTETIPKRRQPWSSSLFSEEEVGEGADTPAASIPPLAAKL